MSLAPARGSLSGSPAVAIPSPEVVDISESEMLLGLFMGALDAGEYDDKLEVIAKWVNRRFHQAQEERAKRALVDLHVGDRVAISAEATPQYLRGITADVVAFDGDAVVVCQGRPLGRFRSGHVRCPPLALVRLAAGQADHST